MAKITKSDRNQRDTVRVKTQDTPMVGPAKWWKGKSKQERLEGLLSTASFLKEQSQYRYRQASIFARLYGNIPLFGLIGTNFNSMTSGQQLPLDRPTMNVVQSCIDTLVSRLTSEKPRPVFLTDAGNYKERNLAKKLNNFINGEFFRLKAHDLGREMLRDASILGDGVIHVYEENTKDGRRVALERILSTELLVDPNDAFYGAPRCMYRVKLVDRDVLEETFPDKAGMLARTEQAFPDRSAQAEKTVSDQLIVVEAWHLPSGPDADDGRHMIVCTNGELVDEEYKKDRFPFVWLPYNKRLVGMYSQGLSEQLMGTQVEINRLLLTISRAINLVGVPRVFVESGSKVVKAHLNNEVGSIVEYQGTKPQYEVAPAMAADVYQQLQRLVDYAYQQAGISALSAGSKKPAGLDSGKALREYDDLQNDRFADLNSRYNKMYVELAYLVIDKARDIALEEGKYSTVYPSKDGTREVDLPKAAMLNDTFVIQCFDSSSLPRDPAGRLQTITEMIQAGMVTIQEGRRLLDYPDLDQDQRLAIAGEERIFKILDEIVDDGKYTPPDPFMDLDLAAQRAKEYYNLYTAAKLDENRAEMLRTFNSQALAMKQEAMAAMAPPPAAPGVPQAMPEPLPTSPLVPNNQ
jgi:hypothetical protein